MWLFCSQILFPFRIQKFQKISFQESEWDRRSKEVWTQLHTCKSSIDFYPLFMKVLKANESNLTHYTLTTMFFTKILLSSTGKQVWLFLLSHHCVKDTSAHEEIPNRFLSVSHRGKTIESHCLDDDSGLKKKSLFSFQFMVKYVRF